MRRLQIELFLSSDVTEAHQNFEIHFIAFQKVKTWRQLRKTFETQRRLQRGNPESETGLPKRRDSETQRIAQKRDCETLTIQLELCEILFRKTIRHP